MTTVNCSYIELEPEPFNGTFNPVIDTTIFYADLNQFRPFIKDLESTLNDQESTKSSRSHRQDSRHTFIIRRGILRILLCKVLNCLPIAIEFKSGENKRPEIRFPENTSLVFSSSHSFERIAIAIGNGLVGIDIEHINPEFKYQDIASRYFSRLEQEFIDNSPNPIDTFFSFWTRKEALLKANSFGIDEDLILVPSADGAHRTVHPGLSKAAHWEVKSFYPEDADYIISLASSLEAKFALFELNSEVFDLK